MSSIFTMRTNIEDFSDCFDLINNHLSKSLISNILTEYEQMRIEEPDNTQIIMDSEALLTLLGEHQKAIELLEEMPGESGFRLSKLRTASHYAALGDYKTMEVILRALMKDPITAHEVACAFIAAGRLGYRDAAIGLWKELLRKEGVMNLSFTQEVLDDPDSFTCISTLSLRERIEVLDFLFQFDIKENRDIELYSHTSSLHFQVGLIYDALWNAMIYEGTYTAFTGFVVAIAIATGAFNVIKNLRDTVTVLEPRVFQELIMNLEGVRRNKAKYAIGEGLLTLFSGDTPPDQASLDSLIRDTDGDLFQVYEMLGLFKSAGLVSEVTPLLEIITRDIPDIENKVADRKELESYLGPCPDFSYS